MAPNRVDAYPIKVTIDATTGGAKTQVWSGSQKDLFSKYGHRAVPEIKKSLQKLK